MRTKKRRKQPVGHKYSESRGILGEITSEEAQLSLDETLKREILSGKRKRRLENVSLKIDPLFIQSIKKIAVKKAIPYQTLIRQWLAEEIKKEMQIS